MEFPIFRNNEGAQVFSGTLPSNPQGLPLPDGTTAVPVGSVTLAKGSLPDGTSFADPGVPPVLSMLNFGASNPLYLVPTRHAAVAIAAGLTGPLGYKGKTTFQV